MKKLLLTIVIMVFGFVGTSFAYMENRAYCTIWSNSIVVTLDKENNYRCSDYTYVLAKAIHKEYNNVLAIQKLIKQKYDIEFWTTIREKKRDQIKKMLLIKTQIEKSVSKFEDNLFYKTKEYMIYTTEPYRLKYRRLLRPLELLSAWAYLNFRVRSKIKLMQEQLDIINQLSLAEDFDALMKTFNRYVYLKNQIEWK